MYSGITERTSVVSFAEVSYWSRIGSLEEDKEEGDCQELHLGHFIFCKEVTA